MNRVLTVFIPILLATLPIAESQAYRGHHQHNNSGYHSRQSPNYSGRIYWQGRQFYQASNGVIYASYYNKQTIQDLRDFAVYHRMQYFYIMPDGYNGAVPRHLKGYMYKIFSKAGIQIVEYSSQRFSRHGNHREGLYFEFRF